jgi:hypothetical protein
VFPNVITKLNGGKQISEKVLIPLSKFINVEMPDCRAAFEFSTLWSDAYKLMSCGNSRLSLLSKNLRTGRFLFENSGGHALQNIVIICLNILKG